MRNISVLTLLLAMSMMTVWAEGKLHEGLTIVCTPRDKNNDPDTSIILPIAIISCYYSEGETFDIPIEIPGQLPEGNYCISAASPNRIVINKLFAFVITAASGIANVIVDDNNQSLPLKGESEGALYNLAGQRVNKSYKGILIQNGKRFVNK